MSPMKILVVGSGVLGSAVLGGLTARKADFDVSVLVRETSLADATKTAKFDKLRADGVHFVHGDGSESAAVLAPKFKGFHTVISTIPPPFKAIDTTLIEACKLAGVNRFVPSSWGSDLTLVGRGSSVPMFDDKLDVEDAVRASGLDYLIFYNGAFTEYLFGPILGIDLEKGIVVAQGSFDQTFMHTSLQDVGHLAAAALLDQSLHKTIVRIASETISFEQLAQALEKAGKKITRQITPIGGNRALFNDPDFMTALFARFRDYLSMPGTAFDTEKDSWNKKFLPNYHTVTIDEYAKKLLSGPSTTLKLFGATVE